MFVYECRTRDKETHSGLEGLLVQESLESSLKGSLLLSKAETFYLPPGNDFEIFEKDNIADDKSFR